MPLPQHFSACRGNLSEWHKHQIQAPCDFLGRNHFCLKRHIVLRQSQTKQKLYKGERFIKLILKSFIKLTVKL